MGFLWRKSRKLWRKLKLKDSSLAKQSQQKICKDQAAMGRSGVVSDYVSARMDCAGDAHDGIMAKAEKDPEQKKQVVLNKNIVYLACFA